MRASIETLHGQQALVDKVMEKAGALDLHTRQVEALIERMRGEREVTDKVRAAVADLRQKKDVA